MKTIQLMQKGGREAKADQPYQPVTGESMVEVGGWVGQGLAIYCGLRTSFTVVSW